MDPLGRDPRRRAPRLPRTEPAQPEDDPPAGPTPLVDHGVRNGAGAIGVILGARELPGEIRAQGSRDSPPPTFDRAQETGIFPR